MSFSSSPSSSSSSSRMKIFRRRTHHFSHHHHHQHHHHRRSHQYLEKLKKYYKWLLWLSLSLYLFFSTATSSSSSFLILPLPLPLLKTSLPFKTTPRALSDDPIIVAATTTTTTTTSSSSTNGASSPPPPPLRIYVYDLPSRFNRDWLSDPRCGSHLFAAEVAIHEALLGHGDRALDPADADLFFVPVYVSCNFSTPTGLPSLRHARPLLASAVRLVSSRLPFWNRSAGRDHLFVASHDFAACFHPMEDVAVADGIPDFLRNSILLQTFGSRRPHHPCQQAAHVVIPPYVPPDIALDLPDPAAAPRDIWAFFRGKMEVHPKNISGRFYSKKVRTEILERYGGNPRFYLKRKRFAGYRAEIARSVFCLCPLGWAPWSPRLVEAVVLGCVPVIIADDIRLPFPDAVRWAEISLAVAERDVARLEAVLDHAAATNLTAIQRNLWDPAKRRALLFHRPMQDGDATWQAIRELRGMLGRSGKRRPGGESGADTWR